MPYSTLMRYLGLKRPPGASCSNCGFWLKNVDDPNRGLCLRLSSRTGKDIETHADDWCEHYSPSASEGGEG